MIWFTADEHYGHSNIIKYCNRPFDDLEEMDDEIIDRHNSVVCEGDTVIHAGDFTLAKKEIAEKYIRCLNGKTHVFIKGSHDSWLSESTPAILEYRIGMQYVVVCHYAMRVWSRSHYNSWQLFGHSHGRLEPVGKQWDIGVDNNNFYPLSFEQIKEIMKSRPDNFNLVRKLRSKRVNSSEQQTENN